MEAVRRGQRLFENFFQSRAIPPVLGPFCDRLETVRGSPMRQKRLIWVILSKNQQQIAPQRDPRTHPTRGQAIACTRPTVRLDARLARCHRGHGIPSPRSKLK